MVDMDRYQDELLPDNGSTNFNYLLLNTIEDVQHNLGKLGQRRMIFIWHVPTHARALEARVYMFSRHLKTYGFEVTIIDWASSSNDYDISRAEWIILVCSQSLYAMFKNTTEPSEIHSLNTRATFSNRTLYNRLLNDPTLRVIPVILLQEDDNLLYVPPVLRDPKNVMRIFEDTPFDVRKVDGHLERLICRMAGIDRMKLSMAENNHHQGFVKLASKIPLG